MFRKYLFFQLLFLSIVYFSFGQVYAQEEEGEIIIISKRVGKKIELIKYKKVIQTLGSEIK